MGYFLQNLLSLLCEKSSKGKVNTRIVSQVNQCQRTELCDRMKRSIIVSCVKQCEKVFLHEKYNNSYSCLSDDAKKEHEKIRVLSARCRSP